MLSARRPPCLLAGLAVATGEMRACQLRAQGAGRADGRRVGAERAVVEAGAFGAAAAREVARADARDGRLGRFQRFAKAVVCFSGHLPTHTGRLMLAFVREDIVSAGGPCGSELPACANGRRKLS